MLAVVGCACSFAQTCMLHFSAKHHQPMTFARPEHQPIQPSFNSSSCTLQPQPLHQPNPQVSNIVSPTDICTKWMFVFLFLENSFFWGRHPAGLIAVGASARRAQASPAPEARPTTPTFKGVSQKRKKRTIPRRLSTGSSGATDYPPRTPPDVEDVHSTHGSFCDPAGLQLDWGLARMRGLSSFELEGRTRTGLVVSSVERTERQCQALHIGMTFWSLNLVPENNWF